MNPSARSSNSSSFVDASGPPQNPFRRSGYKNDSNERFLNGFPSRKRWSSKSEFGRDLAGRMDWGRPGQNASFRNRNVKTSTRNTSPSIQSSSFRIQSSHPNRSGSTCLGELSEIHEQLELGLWVLELRLWVLGITFRLLGLALRSLGIALFWSPGTCVLDLGRSPNHVKTRAPAHKMREPGRPPRMTGTPKFDSQHPKVRVPDEFQKNAKN